MHENEMEMYSDLQELFRIEYYYLKNVLNELEYPCDDLKLVLTIKRAYDVICKYTGYEGNYNPDYQSAVISLALTYFQNDRVKFDLIKGNKNIKSVTQGVRSTTYGDSEITIDVDGLTPDVRAMLPYPKLKVFG